MFEIIIYIGSIITAFLIIIKFLEKVLNKIFEPIKTMIKNSDERYCKAYLIDFIKDVENGEEKDTVQLKYAFELYDYYTNELHCNSYIHEMWEREIENGKLKNK